MRLAKGTLWRRVWLITGLFILMLGPLGLEMVPTTDAQYVHEPINRHAVINVAEDYLTHWYWHNDQWNESFPYCLGYADSIDYLGIGFPPLSLSPHS